ncbi:MAG: hypothetical protein RL173_645 [Fibrobacterota bacterium]|jgi:Fe-S-cluster containining protein
MTPTMNADQNPSTTENGTFPAGVFSEWLGATLKALKSGGAANVACGDCVGCCTSSQFIHIEPSEGKTRNRIPPRHLTAAPGMPTGHMLMGYDKKGFCPMMVDGKCTVYEVRPRTCRAYDCRVFTAAGLVAGAEDKAGINERVKNWRFSYPTSRDRDEQGAVKAAAKFIRLNAKLFPGGRIPSQPSQLAILALKVHEVFLPANQAPARTEQQIADAVIDASRKFDASRG